MKFKTITGGTEAEALAKFPWLADATFEKAVIDITQDYLVWKGGTWEGGTWEDGFWKDGIWKNGTWEGGTWEGGTWEDGFWKRGFWEDGIWKNGTWERGQMWSNINQKYEQITYKDGKFTV